MAFIRDKKEERTGIQTGLMPTDSVDMQCDFVMVYRLDATMPERIKQYKDMGYVVHLMTGISWGSYIDYLDGDHDGEKHWDIGQTDRFGNMILHSPKVPYIVPTIGFTDYLTEKLKVAVDAGVEAIHVEEPEFWDRAGYSEAFRREFELYYRKPWTPPHESADARYKCAKLKQYLFTRTIDRVSASLKEYALVKYGRKLRFYVPTHSLINYTQWKIVSPEGKLADIPSVDGCIAQVWTGTSREKNWFDGEFAERTFETAFLEYGVMQELVKGTGRKMWFLHDPIEDNPIFDWNDYRKNYLCTVAASLMHPKINTYEISPWPNRVFENKYPKGAENAESIPPEYQTLLNNMFNTLGTLEEGEENGIKVGILTGDCELYQRDYPDCEFSEAAKEVTGTVLIDPAELISDFKTKLFADPDGERELMLKYMASSAFPCFYSLSLPLLKYGVPVRPVLLDNARRYVGYLNDYDVLIMSYEFMKPDYPDVNNAIAEWVRQGGTLIYVGDGFDPYNGIDSWWTGKFANPAEHLFRMLGINPEKEQEIFPCGDGIAAVWKINPCKFGFSKENADTFRSFFASVTAKKDMSAEYRNYLSVRRDRYIISSVMTESVNEEPLVLKGSFADMFSPVFETIPEKTYHPGDNGMLCDLSVFGDETDIIGTSVRINGLTEDENKIKITLRGAGGFTANIRLYTKAEIVSAEIDGTECRVTKDENYPTVLISFESRVGDRTLILTKG